MAQAVQANKGKGTNDVRNMLPAMPDTRSKPSWSANQPVFVLKGGGAGVAAKEEEDNFDLVFELTGKDNKKAAKKVEQANAQRTKIKKDREKFRKALVDIILQGEDKPFNESLEGDKVVGLEQQQKNFGLTGAEKDVLRYYYYIHHGIDTEHVAPMEDAWMENIMSFVGKAQRGNHTELLEDLEDEIKEDYLLSVKKAIVDFVLKEPREKEEEPEELPEHRQELAVVPKPWEKGFYACRRQIDRSLHITNPCMNQVLELWHKTFT